MPWTVEETSDCFQAFQQDITDPVTGDVTHPPFVNPPVAHPHVEADPDHYHPRYGALCELIIDQNAEGAVGALGFDSDPLTPCEDGTGSGAVYRDQIVTGVETTCEIGDSVKRAGGVKHGQTLQGLLERLTREDGCDDLAGADLDQENELTDAGLEPLGAAAYGPWDPAAWADKLPYQPDGIDDFFEVWNLARPLNVGDPARGLVPRLCLSDDGSSPRAVDIVIIHNISDEDGATCNSGPNNCYKIRGVSRMYIEGCSDGTAGGFYKSCNIGGGPFIIHGRFVEPVEFTNFRTGIWENGTIQVRLIE